jgi:hypothetical protein
MSTYRANVTDQSQTALEQAENEGGILTFEQQKTRVVARGNQTGSERTQNAGVNLYRNAGVVIPPSDRPNEFLENTIGKRQ